MKKIRVYKDSSGKVVATVEQSSSGEIAPEPHPRQNLTMEEIEVKDDYPDNLHETYKQLR